MPTYSKLMITLGLVLFACGFGGWASAGFSLAAKSAILSGAITAVVLVLTGWLSARTEGLVGPVALYCGTFLLPIFTVVFAWRAFIVWGQAIGGEPKHLVALLISVMALACLATFIALLLMWPAKGGRAT